jgi:beta-lactamase regulating signal transducer with metallopeptidase domain
MSVLLMSALKSLGCATAGVTVMAIAMWLLLRLCRVRSLAIQRFAWLLVLLPGVVVWRMSVVLPVLPAGEFLGVDVHPESERGRPMSDIGTGGQSIRWPSDETSVVAASQRIVGVWACAMLLGVWVAGMIVLAARWAWSYVAFARGLPQPLSPADQWIVELRDVCEELCLPRPIPLHVTERFGPALCLASGGYRLLVPQATWARFSTQQRRSILRHELAHYVRGDLWKSLLARLLAWPQWFNPLAWLAVRRFEEAAECACDDAVVAAERENAFDYLRALVELGTIDYSAQTLQASVHGGSLQCRVRRLLSPAGNDSVMKKLVVIAAALALAAGGFARIRLASAQLPAPPSEKRALAAASGSTGQSPASENESKVDSAKVPVVSLLPNGGLEHSRDNSNDPQGWFATRIPQTRGHFLLTVSSSIAHSGERSAVVVIGDSHPDFKVAYNWTAVAKGWQAGETYELSGWIKVENANRPAFIMAQCWSEDGKRMIGGATTQMAFPVQGTTDWTRVSTQLKVPEGTSVVRIRAGLSSQDNPGAKAWFDDLSFVKVATVAK